MGIIDIICISALVGIILWVIISNHDNNRPAI